MKNLKNLPETFNNFKTRDTQLHKNNSRKNRLSGKSSYLRGEMNSPKISKKGVKVNFCIKMRGGWQKRGMPDFLTAP